MFGRVVSKACPAVEAYGEVDELNAALGLARALSSRARVTAVIAARQAELIGLMGELATALEDRERYATAGYARITAQTADALTTETSELEAEFGVHFSGWATPGADTTPCGAALDLARTVCRRAERKVLAAGETNPDMMRYLNRLSDFLWLLARSEAAASSESRDAAASPELPAG
jgi:cob(I)alamin adenosyltransferase